MSKNMYVGLLNSYRNTGNVMGVKKTSKEGMYNRKET